VALPPPSPAPVQEPTLAEDFDDDLPDDLAAPKKPAKAIAKPSKNGERSHLLQAG
jgi:hypothetical protein